MAPLQFHSLELQPHLVLGQNGASQFEITLTNTQASSTSTTRMELSRRNASTADPSATTTTTSSLATIVPAATDSNSNNNSVVIGAVLGSILGLLVLLTLVWKCCYDNRSVLWVGPTYYSESEIESENSSRSGRVRKRGGAGFNKRNSRGHTVRRPERVRSHRMRSGDSDGSEPSGAARSDATSYYSQRKRRSGNGMVTKDGMWGWTLGSGGVQKYGGRRDSWAGERRTASTNLRFSVDD